MRVTGKTTLKSFSAHLYVPLKDICIDLKIKNKAKQTNKQKKQQQQQQKTTTTTTTKQIKS